MERSGATENTVVRRNSLKALVGAWGFEPQTPTVSSPLESTSTKFTQKILHCMHCIHCFNCTFSTFLCANLCAHFIAEIKEGGSSF